ncbi:hypothetical protein E5D57_001628 [Metarhizium anisopliae]|nr:hypothetical protein E5D57_001628 [Metarhizium anisopliae]
MYRTVEIPGLMLVSQVTTTLNIEKGWEKYIITGTKQAKSDTTNETLVARVYDAQPKNDNPSPGKDSPYSYFQVVDTTNLYITSKGIPNNTKPYSLHQHENGVVVAKFEGWKCNYQEGQAGTSIGEKAWNPMEIIKTVAENESEAFLFEEFVAVESHKIALTRCSKEKVKTLSYDPEHPSKHSCYFKIPPQRTMTRMLMIPEKKVTQ